MKKISLPLLFIMVLPLAWCSLPVRETVTITLQIWAVNYNPLNIPVTASILDAEGKIVIEKVSRKLGNSPFAWIDFWTNNPDNSTPVAPEKLYKAKSIRITGEGCKPLVIPLNLTKEFIPISFYPHGAGPAYVLYRMDESMVMECNLSKPDKP